MVDRPSRLVLGAGGAQDHSLSKPATVSIVIPCRDEETFIGACLDSIVANDYPKDSLEVLVVDGMSEDGTRAIVHDYAKRQPFIRLLNSPKKITPAGLNIGIANSTGKIIMRMDAHNTYPPNYISGLVGWLEKTQADNVGGVWITVPATQTFMAEAIALALSHPFGVGNAYFRIGVKEPRWVDTVPFGCYRREVFDRIGMFDEELVRNQDDEFNLRLIRRGGRILLAPDIVSYYYPRESLMKLWRMYYQYGYFKPLVAKKVGGILTVRQVIPAVFVLGLLASGTFAPWTAYGGWALCALVFAYVVADLGSSICVGFQRGLRCAFAIPVVFPVLHLSYGLGFLKGALDFFILGNKRRGDADRISITR
jgi:glycosyltransferase involved in cell wall biosynthesis